VTTQTLILTAAGALLLTLFIKYAVRSFRASLDDTPVSDYWLAQRRRVRDEGID
jgi:hypothetical protein